MYFNSSSGSLDDHTQTSSSESLPQLETQSTVESTAGVSTPPVDYDDIASIPSRDSLSDDQKHHILTCKPIPLKEYPFNKQKRRFQSKWYEQFSWLRYSKSVDGVFCAPCYLFDNAHVSNEFASTPFSDWKNAIGKAHGAFNRHSLSQNHSSCSERAASFLAVMDKRMPSIRSQLNTSYHSQVERNRKALISIVDSIQFMIKKGLPLRGHSWNKDTKREEGNLCEMVNFVSKYSVELDSHIRT